MPTITDSPSEQSEGLILSEFDDSMRLQRIIFDYLRAIGGLPDPRPNVDDWMVLTRVGLLRIVRVEATDTMCSIFTEFDLQAEAHRALGGQYSGVNIHSGKWNHQTHRKRKDWVMLEEMVAASFIYNLRKILPFPGIDEGVIDLTGQPQAGKVCPLYLHLKIARYRKVENAFDLKAQRARSGIKQQYWTNQAQIARAIADSCQVQFGNWADEFKGDRRIVQMIQLL